MNEANMEELLRLFCREFIAINGQAIHKLPEWKFSYTAMVQRPENHEWLNRKCPVEGDQGKFVQIIFDDLVARGYFKEEAVQYWLTQEGFERGTETQAQKFLRHLNSNPGMAIIVSLLSLVISAGALYVAYTKP